MSLENLIEKPAKFETPVNYEQKTICCLVVDVSGSMAGMPINQLNQGLKQFHAEIQQDNATANRLEIAIVEFSDTVDIVQQPAMVDQFVPPVLQTKGSTALVDGVREGINLVRARKQFYKSTGQPYNRPWIILITDGAPDKGQDVGGLAQEIANGMASKDFFFLGIGVAGADMSMLENIAGSYTDKTGTHKVSPLPLDSAKFSEFFKWLSHSMAIASSDANSPGGHDIPVPTWLKGYQVN
jgi:uncharacterized protein YegL